LFAGGVILSTTNTLAVWVSGVVTFGVTPPYQTTTVVDCDQRCHVTFSEGLPTLSADPAPRSFSPFPQSLGKKGDPRDPTIDKHLYVAHYATKPEMDHPPPDPDDPEGDPLSTPTSVKKTTGQGK
jgi:hypothetical protein